MGACSGAIDIDGAQPWSATGTPGSAPAGVNGTPAPGTNGPGVPPGAAAGSGASAPTTPGGVAGGDTCQDGRLAGRAVMLAPRQYVNVLRDILGPEAVSEDDAATTGELVFETIDLPRVTTSTLDRFVRLSDGAVETLRGGKAGTLLGCTSLMDDACVRRGIDQVARRFYKRPLEAGEVDELMTLRQTGLAAVATDQGETATLAALQAVMLAPSTLYRTEFYAKTQAGSPLTVHERAAALGAFLLDSVPDAPLMAAADDGSLMTRPGLEAQVDRLLALPRVRNHLTQVVLNAFNVQKLFGTPKDVKVFPEYADLQNSMYEETRRFIEDILWTRSAPLGELLTSRRSFVDAGLAKLYGVAAPSGGGFAPVELPPERAGILTQPSVLAVLSRTDVNSVVARGLYVRGNLLCLPKIPGPPASVQAQVTAQLDA
ncbi:MAG: DUF1592 domain-containing protein, partial [Polyangiales bacterium]